MGNYLLKEKDVVEGHIVKLGTIANRPVYHFIDIDKYWIAPQGALIMGKAGSAGVVYLYLDTITDDGYRKGCSLGDAGKIDYTTIFDLIKKRARPIFETFGCRRFSRSLLFTKPYYLNKKVHRGKEYYNVLALGKVLPDNGGASRVLVGAARANDIEKLRKLVAHAKQKGLETLKEREKLIDLPVSEAFILLDTNPMEQICANHPDQSPE